MIFAALGRSGVRTIDRILRWHMGIFEFTSEPQCYLRIARVRCPRDLILSDGTPIHAGDALVSLHLWNEHLPRMSCEEANLRWSLTFLRGGLQSLKQLAHFLEAQPEFHDVRAIYADMGFVTDTRLARARRLLTRVGFDLIEGEKPAWDIRRRAFWDNVLSWWLIWTFNSASLKGKSFSHLRRCELWMLREQLIKICSFNVAFTKEERNERFKYRARWLP